MSKDKGKEIFVRSSAAEYLTFVAAGGNSRNIEIRYVDENIWLTQKMLSSLYDVDVRTINYHIKKIFNDSELEADAVIRNFRITAATTPSITAVTEVSSPEAKAIQVGYSLMVEAVRGRGVGVGVGCTKVSSPAVESTTG